jgi:inosine-uridine nucleoside N-ribohydrolase
VRKVLVDTDIGTDADDALALALVLAVPDQLDLVAVTTVAGDTAVRAQIASRLLAAGGRPDVEICAGEGEALVRSAFHWAGHEEQAIAAGPDAILSTESAPERIVRAAREVDGLEIVAIGPMTNLARALMLDPELPTRAGGLTIMGGHIRRVAVGSHVCAPGIDYNLCSDAEASALVLGAGFRTTLVTADVTLETWLRAGELEALRAAGPFGERLAAQVDLWTPVQRRIFTGIGGDLADDNAVFLHDPLTVLALVEPELLHFETLRIATTIERSVLRTREVDAALDLGIEMRVATRVDGARASRSIAAHLLRVAGGGG